MKLFKKAMAAVLAGVMALAMVACTPVAPVDPEKPVDPTLTEEQQFFQMLNNKVEALEKNVNWGKEVKATFPTFENNAELKAEAEKILNAVAEGTVEYSSTTGKPVSYKLKKACTLGTGVNAAFIATLAADTTFNINETENALKFDADGAKAWVASGIVANGGWLTKVETKVGTKVTAIEYKAVYDFGFATKVINGQTCVAIVYKAAA